MAQKPSCRSSSLGPKLKLLSGKGVAIMIERWDALTRFLSIPGAPIDNNVDERLLKTAILHPKNSLHYKTERGAAVGDFFMSMIQTCVANGANPYDYLLSAARNAEALKKDPGRWMPWNYKETLAARTPDAGTVEITRKRPRTRKFRPSARLPKAHAEVASILNRSERSM